MSDTPHQTTTSRSTRVGMTLLFLMIALIGLDRFFDADASENSSRFAIAIGNILVGSLGFVYNIWALWRKQ